MPLQHVKGVPQVAAVVVVLADAGSGASCQLGGAAPADSYRHSRPALQSGVEACRVVGGGAQQGVEPAAIPHSRPPPVAGRQCAPGLVPLGVVHHRLWVRERDGDDAAECTQCWAGGTRPVDAQPACAVLTLHLLRGGGGGMGLKR